MCVYTVLDGCLEVGRAMSRLGMGQNPAAVIPICDDEGEGDDGYTTASEYFVEDSSATRKVLPALTEPIRLERQKSSSSGSGGGGGVLSSVLELLKGIRVGSDVTKLQLPPQFNLPKSQLQVYGEAVYCCGEDYLSLCSDAATPLDRLLAVVRFHLSTTRPAPFLKAPYNPILGEVHHVSVGALNVICEQVNSLSLNLLLEFS